jgi:hypothetical protein
MNSAVKNLIRDSLDISEDTTFQYLRETEKSHEKPDLW